MEDCLGGVANKTYALAVVKGNPPIEGLHHESHHTAHGMLGNCLTGIQRKACMACDVATDEPCQIVLWVLCIEHTCLTQPHDVPH